MEVYVEGIGECINEKKYTTVVYCNDMHRVYTVSVFPKEMYIVYTKK